MATIETDVNTGSGLVTTDLRAEMAAGALPIGSVDRASEQLVQELIDNHPIFKDLPHPSEIPVCARYAEGHPLESLIIGDNRITSREVDELLQSPEVQMTIGIFPNGTVPAANNETEHSVETDSRSYAKHAWTRDKIIVAFALRRAGHTEMGNAVLSNLHGFYASPDQRQRFFKNVFANTATAREWYDKGTNIPHIKAEIVDGQMVPYHDWGHQQLDAMGMWLWGTFRAANAGDLNLPDLNQHFAKQVNPNEADESTLGLAIKFLNRIQFWDLDDFGPWEDEKHRSRGTSIGICVAALEEAQKFFETHEHGYNALPNGMGEDAAHELKVELHTALHYGRQILNERVPSDGGLAVECDHWDSDAALSFLLYPFAPQMNPAQENAILRTLFERREDGAFRRIGELGITRRDGDDFVGQDYIYEQDRRGMFADMEVEDYRAAEWTLFDPLLCAYFSRKYVESVQDALQAGSSRGEDKLSLMYARRFFRRMAAQFTKENDEYQLAHDGSHVQVGKGIIPEAYFWDTTQDRWRANHHSPLLMANATHALALARLKDALDMHEVLQRTSRQRAG